MEIVLSNSSGVPIYEQIASQIRSCILSGELDPGEALPSIRGLAATLRISAITTKRAFAELEAQGLIETVPGKGSFVAGIDPELLQEERLRRVEQALSRVLLEAREAQLGRQELVEMLDLMFEEE
ncbi:GntR family transcriptional regulator [Olsenella urininfantis]|uniref:GntR family transcriptional regulator n=1 Tax=Olsenella urininfantis TaxID=1871033 RepID=UPI000984ED6F|nr:GntR family transcriptional regulator [Olsenella urininfantis]